MIHQVMIITPTAAQSMATVPDIISLPMSIVGISTIIAFIIGGILFLVGLFSKSKQQVQQTADEATTFVISSLKEQVKILETKVSDQQKSITDMSLQLEGLKGENRKLTEILQGRDIKTQEFQDQGFAVIKSFPDLFKLVRDTNEGVKITNANVERLYTSMNRLLKIMESGQGVTTSIPPMKDN